MDPGGETQGDLIPIRVARTVVLVSTDTGSVHPGSPTLFYRKYSEDRVNTQYDTQHRRYTMLFWCELLSILNRNIDHTPHSWQLGKKMCMKTE